MSIKTHTLPPEPPRHVGPSDDEIAVPELLRALVQRWRLVAGLPLGAALLTGVLSFLIPPTFTASTTLVPESRSQSRVPTAFAGLAGQFGISLGTEPTQSPRFYAEILKSRGLMERVLLASYPDPRGGRSPADSATLLDILGVEGDSLPDRLEHGVQELDRLTVASVGTQTNIIRLSVDSRYPALAAAVANRFVAFLNEFNAKSRQSYARARREFVGERIRDEENELRRAEEELKTFYNKNRSWQEGPQSVVDEGRLRRQVDIQRDVYLTLRREYETSRIEEVNDTPVITVIDAARVPQVRSKPERAFLVIVAFILGALAVLGWTLGVEQFDRFRRRAR